MKHFVPDFILKQFSDKQLDGEFNAYTMIIDISGFTSMTQELMSEGKEGAEIISDIINDVFSDSIKIIYEHTGFISSFAGDAFIAIFDKDLVDYPLNACFEIKKKFENKVLSAKSKTYTLTVKISLSYGNVKYQIIETQNQCFYYFKGNPISQCHIGEKFASNKKIVADVSFINKSVGKIIYEDIEKDWFVVKEITSKSVLTKNVPKIIDTISEDIFISNALQNIDFSGEYRDIVSVFINFEESLELIIDLINLCEKYGAYLNKIVYTNNACFALIIFGAPYSQEKLYQRAVSFLLRLKLFNNFKLRVGVSTGVSFCGLIGSDLRCEYTVLGDVVNLSARLSNHADVGEILCDQRLTQMTEKIYVYRSKGMIGVKGFSKTVNTFSLIGKKISDTTKSFPGKFIGRKKEKLDLLKCLNPVFKQVSAGIIYIEGVAGIGKSHFVVDFINSFKSLDFAVCKRSNYIEPDFIYLPCEDIVKKSFNPFEWYLKRFFNFDDFESSQQRLEVFTEKFQELITQLRNLSSTDAQLLIDDLIQKRNFIALLTGIHIDKSIFIDFDSKAKYENIVHGLKSFLLAQSLIKPSIFIFDDVHVIDSDSKVVIESLLRNSLNFPFAIIAVCRPDDYGNNFNLKLNLDTGIVSKRILIEKFDKKFINEMISDKFKKDSVSQEITDFIWKKSDGNPFYAEQIILYLKENENLTLKHQTNIPLQINQIIISRIDRLSNKLKDAIKSASVLGMEFVLSVLKQMLILKNIVAFDQQFIEQLKDGTHEQIWEDLNDIKYIFKHALIRDTVYETQLKKNLRDLHHLAGTVIEDLYKNDLANHYEELAQHYEKAEDFQKAVFFLNLSAEKSRNLFQNTKVLDYYNRLLKLYDILGNSNEFLHTLNKKLEIYEITGSWKEGLKLLEEYKFRFDTNENKQYLVDFLNFYGEFLKMLGKPTEAFMKIERAKLIAEKINYKAGLSTSYSYLGLISRDSSDFNKAIEYFEISKDLCEESANKAGVNKAYGNLATVYYMQGKTQQATEFFQKLHDFSVKIDDKRTIASSSGNLGVMYYIQGSYEKALKCYLKQYEISELIGDKLGLGRSTANIGLIYYTYSDYDKALDFYNKNIRICEQTGDKMSMGKTLCNIGVLYKDILDYPQAMTCYMKFLKISEEIKDKQGITIAYGNIGGLFLIQGKYLEAMSYFQNQLSSCEEIGDKNGVGKAIGNIGKIYIELGEYDKAMDFLQKEIVINKELNDQKSLSFTFSNIGLIYEKQMSFTKAHEFYDRAIKIAKDLNIMYSLCRCLYLKANLLFIEKNIVDAEKLNSEALNLAEKIKRKDIVTKSITLKGLIKNDINLLLGLSETELTKFELAEVYYWIWKINKSSECKHKAKHLHDNLLDFKNNKEFNYRYLELNRD